MTDCWGEIGGSRKQPQAIMRDINQIKYQVYNSRRSHAYAIAFPKRANDSELIDDDFSEVTEHNSSSDCESRASSLFTDRTSLPWDDSEDNIGGIC
jgi:Janus kinase 2